MTPAEHIAIASIVFTAVAAATKWIIQLVRRRKKKKQAKHDKQQSKKED